MFYKRWKFTSHWTLIFFISNLFCLFRGILNLEFVREQQKEIYNVWWRWKVSRVHACVRLILIGCQLTHLANWRHDIYLHYAEFCNMVLEQLYGLRGNSSNMPTSKVRKSTNLLMRLKIFCQVFGETSFCVVCMFHG